MNSRWNKRLAAAMGSVLLGPACSQKPAAPTAAEPSAAVALPEAASPTPAAQAPPSAVRALSVVRAPSAAPALPPPVTATDANPWHMAPVPARVPAGSRAYVLTSGSDRTYRDGSAVYHLYAYDVVESRGQRVTIAEIGGGSFRVPALYVIPAGVSPDTALPEGTAVLAEWASSLKHATVVASNPSAKASATASAKGATFTIRYTDLPETWAEDKVTATKTRRQLTIQREGLQPGNFAMATIDGGRYQVLLIAESAGRWLVRRFAGRVVALPASDLTPIPLRPKLRRGSKVLAPWVGMMYPGVIRSVKGAAVTVHIAQIGKKKPVSTALGQVLPMTAAANRAHD